MAKQDIFYTLKHYSKGFHDNADAESNKIYDAKIEELTARIREDVTKAPEIIADEYRKSEIERYRLAFTKGRMPMYRYDAERKAIDNIVEALMDSAPLKPGK